MHAPIGFSGNLSLFSEWVRLLNLLTSLKQTEGAPAGQVYFGLVPHTNSRGDRIPSSIGGVGWIGLRVSVGFDDGGYTAAHEIGHNFGLPHAPCGPVGDPDPYFPYAYASIGQYGYDVLSNDIINPGVPEYTKDIMSYCWPEWFSDYNYRKLYDDQLAHGATIIESADSHSLFIRVTFDAGDSPHLLPVYFLHDLPTAVATNSEFAVEIVDKQGRLIASYPVAAGRQDIADYCREEITARTSLTTWTVRESGT
jgi:hypothetical protein